MPFTKENAKEMQLLGAAKRKQNNADRKAFGAYLDELLNEVGGQYNGEPATRKMILMVKWLKYVTDDNADLSEGKDFTAILKEIRDTIGEKPTEHIAHAVEDESARYIDEYFARKDNQPTGG